MSEAAIHVLLLEDDESHAELVRRTFEDEPQFRIAVVTRISQAREAMRAHPPQLVLADLVLPDGRGTDLLAELDPARGPPLVLLTSHGDESVAVEAIKAGALDYIVKSPQTFSAMPSVAARALREWSHIVDRQRAEAEVRETVSALRELHRITTLESDFDDMLGEVLRLGSARLGLAGGALTRLRGRQHEVREVVGLPEPLVKGSVVPEASLFGVTLQRREPLCIERVSSSTLENATRGAIDVAAYAGIVVMVGQAVYGTLSFYDVTARQVPFRSTDTELLKLMAQWIGGALWRQQTVEALGESERRFQQAQRLEAVGRLASGVAHDYNNLLMGIGGCIDVALKKIDAESSARLYLEEAKRATTRGTSLTRQLLTFARKQSSEPTEIDLNAVIEGTENLMRSLAGESVDLVLELAPSTSRLRASLGQMEQVVMNLVVNARDAMPDGGRLVVRTEELAVDGVTPLPEGWGVPGADLALGRYVVLTVQDTGCGMEKGVQEKIFEPFFTTKDVGQGTGLGLSTVYSIVEEAGGRIVVESAPGVGTTFTILLPTSIGAPADVTGEPASRSNKESTETVLVVEDDSLVRMAVRTYLQEAGYQVLEASTPAEAHKKCREHGDRIDLVLSDVMLQGATGLAVVDDIRSRWPKIKAMFMSAHPEDMLVQSGRLRPGFSVLQKPFDEETLTEALRRVLDQA